MQKCQATEPLVSGRTFVIKKRHMYNVGAGADAASENTFRDQGLNMRAAVLHDIRDIRVTDIPAPTPAADEVIVRVKAVGVCGSDLHSYLEGGTTGPTRINPFVLGHEFSGTLTPETARRSGLP